MSPEHCHHLVPGHVAEAFGFLFQQPAQRLDPLDGGAELGDVLRAHLG
jgi:hypothetical protein